MAILLPDTTPDCRTVRLKTFPDERGWLTCADAYTDIPFPVKRLFLIYNVPEEATRGGHANWKCAEAIFPLKGSFDIYVDDGKQHATLHMDQPDTGIIIPAGVWCLHFYLLYLVVLAFIARELVAQSAAHGRAC